MNRYVWWFSHVLDRFLWSIRNDCRCEQGGKRQSPCNRAWAVNISVESINIILNWDFGYRKVCGQFVFWHLIENKERTSGQRFLWSKLWVVMKYIVKILSLQDSTESTSVKPKKAKNSAVGVAASQSRDQRSKLLWHVTHSKLLPKPEVRKNCCEVYFCSTISQAHTRW